MGASNQRIYIKIKENQITLESLFRLLVASSLLCTNLCQGSVSLPPTEVPTHPVFTFKNASTALGQLVTSSTLVWESYNPKDPKQLQYAVEGGKYITEEEHYPIYVCRVTIDGVPTSGHTEKIKQMHECVAAHYRHGKYSNFDILVNKGHLSKISWEPWRTFNAGIPIGSIAIGEDGYIGRHRAPHQEATNENDTLDIWGADYNFGRLDPNEGLGKIKVLENDTEKNYDEGEVLVETEPFRYELRDIKLDNIRLDIRDNLTELASAVLSNRGEKYSRVETVMSYEFDQVQYWGSHDGTARGLPTKIYEKYISTPTEVNWGLKYSERRYETKNVHTILWPGTAMNVTLRGNYITLEAPYTARLFAFYYGSNSTVSKKINSDIRKLYLKDIKLEYSPVYWLENGTFVPTSTTSTTSTTARVITTSTNNPAPLNEPPVVHLQDVGQVYSGPDALEKSHQDSTLATNNENVVDNMPESNQKPALAGIVIANETNHCPSIGADCTVLSVVVILLLLSIRQILIRI